MWSSVYVSYACNVKTLLLNVSSTTILGPQGGSQVWSAYSLYRWLKPDAFLIGHFMNQLYGIILDNQY